MMKEVTIDVQTGEKSTRDLTSIEIEQIEITSEIEQIINENAVEKMQARNALFAKLGITEDEAKLLLG